MEEKNNMDQIQVQAMLDRMKEQIGELTYQIIYRDLVIEALQKQLEELESQKVEIVDGE
jgi:SMC interacting uncharacterized protein involved in chromosome segregation